MSYVRTAWWMSALRVAAPVAMSALLAEACVAAPAVEHAPSPTKDDLVWVLPEPPMPANNVNTPERVELGKILFFDPHISGNGSMSCATCHNPSLGWSDGLKTAVGMNGKVLKRATPTIVNTAYNTQFMWDGRKKSLEDQALGPMSTPEEMNTDIAGTLKRLAATPGYTAMFAKAYPGEGITESTLAKAIAAFERTIVVRDTPFDRWLAGDAKAMTAQQWRGYKAFVDPNKGNCMACHTAPNFTDNGYHNVGIDMSPTADPGRYGIVKIGSMKGAFKTPTLRNVEATAPYFHDGSSASLRQVVDHYVRVGDQRPAGISTSIVPLHLSEQDRDDMVAFMKALTGSRPAVGLPNMPQ